MDVGELIDLMNSILQGIQKIKFDEHYKTWIPHAKKAHEIIQKYYYNLQLCKLVKAEELTTTHYKKLTQLLQFEITNDLAIPSSKLLDIQN